MSQRPLPFRAATWPACFAAKAATLPAGQCGRRGNLLKELYCTARRNPKQAIGKTVSAPAHPLHLAAGFSINGWLAVLLTFLLARVFAEGTLMREDLEGTV